MDEIIYYCIVKEIHCISAINKVEIVVKVVILMDIFYYLFVVVFAF